MLDPKLDPFAVPNDAKVSFNPEPGDLAPETSGSKQINVAFAIDTKPNVSGQEYEGSFEFTDGGTNASEQTCQPNPEDVGFTTTAVVAGPTPSPVPTSTKTPAPTPSPTISCGLGGNVAQVNQLLAGDSFARDLLTAIAGANKGVAPTANTNPLPAASAGTGSAASSQVADGEGVAASVDFPPENVKAAGSGSASELNQQLANQILDHELGHIFYETGSSGSRPIPLPGEVGFVNMPTVTLEDGTILTFTIETGNALAPGYYGYRHVMIHDDLVNAFPSTGDTTQALVEAFQEATTVTFLKGQPLSGLSHADALTYSKTRQKIGITSGAVSKRPPNAPGVFIGCNRGGVSPANEPLATSSPVRFDLNKYWYDPYTVPN
jgi:hypothetical protein